MKSDIVAILDHDSYEVLFDGAHPMGLDIDEAKKITSYPVEDGGTRSDHVVSLPILAKATLLASGSARETYERLRQAFNDHRLLIVQTRVASYAPMMIEAMPHSETVDNLEGVVISITLKEWKTVTPVYGDFPLGSTRNPAQSSTVDRGQQQTTATNEDEPKRKSSVLAGWLN